MNDIYPVGEVQNVQCLCRESTFPVKGGEMPMKRLQNGMLTTFSKNAETAQK